MEQSFYIDAIIWFWSGSLIEAVILKQGFKTQKPWIGIIETALIAIIIGTLAYYIYS